MSDEKLEYFVVYEKQHFEPIRKFECIEKNKPKFQKIDKLTIRWAIDIADFDIEIIKNEF